MKKITFCIAILFIINLIEAQNSWFWQFPYPQGNGIGDIQIFDQNNAIAVGEMSSIIRTSNGGTNWVEYGIENPLGKSCKCIYFVNSQTGWIGGDGIFKTIDGGNNWSLIYDTITQGGSSQITKIKFINSSTGFCLVNSRDFEKSTDGGLSWFHNFPGGPQTRVLHDMFFINENTGWVTGFLMPPSTKQTYMYLTTNGGTNWNYYVTGFDISGLYFLDSLNGFAAGQIDTIRKTTDGGLTWFPIITGIPYAFNNINFDNIQNGWAWYYSSTGAYITITTNLGLNWIVSNNMPSQTTGTVKFFNNVGWAFRYDRIMKSTDWGNNWSYQSDTTSFASSFGFYDICFSDPNTGWAVGSINSIFRTTNGGTNWIKTPLNMSDTISEFTRVQMLNSQTGWIMNQTRLAKTNNNGLNWTILYDTIHGANNVFRDFQFIDENNGIIDASLYLLKTTNGGVNWNIQNFNFGTGWWNIQRIKFTDLNNGLALVIYSDHSQLYKTTDGGNNFTSIFSINYQMNDFYFTNANTGWIVGYNSHISKTTNGGQSWVAQQPFDTNSTYSRVYFSNSNTGYITEYGYVDYTNNGGSTWNREYTSGVTSIFFINPNTGWIAGQGASNGCILKTVIGGVPITYTISGTIYYQDNNQLVNHGYVKALHYDAVFDQIITVDSTGIQSNGTYSLGHVPQDSIFIMVYDNDESRPSFVPTYYPSTINWQNATILYPTENISNINVHVYRANNSSGTYHIGGIINGTSQMAIFQLSGAIIYTKAGNFYRSYDISKSSGLYSADSLLSSNYTVIVDRIGYYTAKRPIYLTNFSFDTINFTLHKVISGIIKTGYEIPKTFSLSQNYPNPFNPTTKIQFAIPRASNIKLKVFDILGKEVTTIVNEKLNPGTYEAEWDASNLATGVYFYRIESGDFSQTKKMVLVK